MNKILNIFFNRLHDFLYFISVLSLSLMLVIIFTQVITRYLFGYSFDWSEEVARFLFVWTVFLGSALIIGDKGHMAVQLLSDKLKGSAAGVAVNVFIQLCGLAFILILIIQGSKMAKVMMFQSSPALGIPMGYIYSIIPLSGILMLLYFIKNTLKILGIEKTVQQEKE